MQKKIPMRMCVSCRQMRPKRELVRIVCNKEGAVWIDSTGRAAGRGAYLCKAVECVERAKKSRALDRALSAKIDEGILDRLVSEAQSLKNDLGAKNLDE